MERSVKGIRDTLAKAAGRDADEDGRSTRWSAHREARRAELVEAAVAAIDKLGPQASVEDIAGAAGVSKPVLYRYFSDKADLLAAVGAYGADLVMAAMAPALVADGALRKRVDIACDAYLALLEEHPNVFLLLVRQRAGDDEPATRWPTARPRSPPRSPGSWATRCAGSASTPAAPSRGPTASSGSA